MFKKWNFCEVSISSGMQSTLKLPHCPRMFLTSGCFLPGSSQGFCLASDCHVSELSLNLNSLSAFFFIHNIDVIEDSRPVLLKKVPYSGIF